MRGLPLQARAYITAMCVAAVLAAVWAGSRPPAGALEISLGLGLAAAATLAQGFEVHMPNNKAYNATLAFLLAAALLVGPAACIVVAATPFVVEQVRRPKQPYIQAFNISTHVISTLAAGAAWTWVRGTWPPESSLDGTLASLAGAALAVLVFLAVNHATLAQVLLWARGVPYRDSGLFGVEGLLTDATLLALGVVVAALWSAGHALVLFALIPFALLQRALYFPELTRASRTDLKTGLINATYFMEVAEDELKRAARFEHPVAILVADLDLLRNINNAYGHLAGDVILRGVAEIMREEIREYDVACRFGGEEFAVLLPAAELEEARTVAERIRQRVAETAFVVDTSVTPISATLSIGVACVGPHGSTVKEVMHAADLAVYRAKVAGRDRVRLASAEDDASTAPLAPTSRPASPVAKIMRTAVETAEPSPAPAAAPEQVKTTAEREPTRTVRSTRLLTAVVTVAACLGATLTLAQTGQPTWALLVFPALALVAELSGESIYGSSFISLSAVPILAAVASGRPAAALAAAAVSALAGGLARRQRVEQILFNTSTFVLSAALATVVRGLGPTGHVVTTSALPQLVLTMLAATIVYFAVDNGLVSSVVGLDEARSPLRVFRDDLAWLLPHFLVFGGVGTLLGAAWSTYGVFGLVTFLLPPALLRVAQRQYLERTTANVAELRRLADDLQVSKAAVEQTNTALQDALGAVRERHLATARALAGAIDARDKTTGGHIERVSALGQAMCAVIDPLLANDPQVIFGFLLHDVGKIGVPDEVLLKPGPLTEAQREIMNRHPDIGADLMTEAGFGEVAREIVLTHHERWDGTGYPRGLAGTEIPLCSRIFSVADSLDAMTNDRPYRAGMPLEQAFDELRAHAGTQFDPMAVEALLALPVEQVRELLRLGLDTPDMSRALANLIG